MPIGPFLMVLAFGAITLAAYLQAKRSRDTVAFVAAGLFAYYTATLVIRFALYFLPLAGFNQNFPGAWIVSFFLYGVLPYVLLGAGGCLLFAAHREARGASTASSQGH